MNLKQFIYKVEKLQLTRSRTEESLLWIALLEISTNKEQTVLLWVRNKSNSMTFLGCSCIQTFPNV